MRPLPSKAICAGSSMSGSVSTGSILNPGGSQKRFCFFGGRQRRRPAASSRSPARVIDGPRPRPAGAPGAPGAWGAPGACGAPGPGGAVCGAGGGPCGGAWVERRAVPLITRRNAVLAIGRCRRMLSFRTRKPGRHDQAGRGDTNGASGRVCVQGVPANGSFYTRFPHRSGSKILKQIVDLAVRADARPPQPSAAPVAFRPILHTGCTDLSGRRRHGPAGAPAAAFC